jgi:hypothetical protein
MFSAYGGDDDPYEITFAIKQITRPAPNVIYEDVNFYNFMTKVATRVDFGVVTVTLFDDRTNKAHDLFQKYMESISPVTNITKESAPVLQNYGQSTTALLGPMGDNGEHGPIHNIRVNHLIDHNGSKVIYDFLNPKIQNVVLDELDMTQSDVNTVTFTFIYDSYNVTTERTSSNGSTESVEYSEDRLLNGPGGAVGGLASNSPIPLEDLPNEGMTQTVSISELPNTPTLLQQIRDQINIDGIPSQVLVEQLQKMGVDTGGLAGSAIRSVIRQIIGSG